MGSLTHFCSSVHLLIPYLFSHLRNLRNSYGILLEWKKWLCTVMQPFTVVMWQKGYGQSYGMLRSVHYLGVAGDSFSVKGFKELSHKICNISDGLLQWRWSENQETRKKSEFALLSFFLLILSNTAPLWAFTGTAWIFLVGLLSFSVRKQTKPDEGRAFLWFSTPSKPSPRD